MELTLQTIEALIDLATEKNLSELTVEQDEQKVTIKTAQAVATVPFAMPSATAQPAQGIPTAGEAPAKPAVSEAAPASNFYKVTSPMVGTFYLAPSPDSPPFVEVGASVSKGQTLCIIEAMKLMNELESEVSGIVRKINIENGMPVEFGQVLMEIEVQ